MHNLASQKVKKVISNVDIKGVKSLLDLGGGPGTYSVAFAEKNIHVTLADYPETLKIAKMLTKDSPARKNISFLPGDFTNNTWGVNYDMVFISHIFHAYSRSECISMLKKSNKILNNSGKVVVQEFYLDESRTSPASGAVFAINMLVNTPSGRTYTPGEMISWMRKSGFASVKKTILDETVLITGNKK
jgi:ubiquinone/menaquinone biosynthesis C-methylase UbiE